MRDKSSLIRSQAKTENTSPPFQRQKVFQLLKCVGLLWLAYSCFHTVFFTTFFSGFLSVFDAFAASLPLSLERIKEWITIKPFYSHSLNLKALSNPLFLVGAILCFYVYIEQFSSFKWRNQSPDTAIWIRLFAFISGSLLTWELSTYEYNFYLDSYFLWDRILLVLFCFGILVHPIFIPAFLISSLLFRSQFSVPLGGFPFYDKRLLFDILILCYSYIFLCKWKKLNTSLFFFFLCCIIGGNYFTTGISKVLNNPSGLAWILENRLDYFFLNAHARGWLQQTQKPFIEMISSFLSNWSIPLQVFVVLIELSGILILFKQKWTRYFLFGVIVLHLAIFATGSMFFWKWIGIDLLLLLFLWKARPGLLKAIFHPVYFRLSLFMIPFASFLFQSYSIGWHDTPLNQIYSYEVECENGEHFSFSKNSFNPYHQLFQHDKFNYLNKEHLLRVSGFGYTTKYQLAKKIRTSTWEELQQLTTKSGKSYYNHSKKVAFSKFISTFFTNYNRKIDSTANLNSIAAPQHIHSTVQTNVYSEQSRIKVVRVYFDQYFIEDQYPILKKHELLLEINI